MSSSIGEILTSDVVTVARPGANPVRSRRFIGATRLLLLTLLGVGCVTISLVHTATALSGRADEQTRLTFLVFLSVLPAPAALGYLLTDRRAGRQSPALAGLLLAVAAWLLIFAALVTHAVVPAVICAGGGWFFGMYALVRYRAGSMAWWAMAVNATLLLAAMFVSTAYLGHPQM